MMSKLFKFLLMLIPVIALTIFTSCGGDDDGTDPDPDPDPTCTFEEDPDCFCDENPNDSQCQEEPCTFEEDPECFCDENPDDAQCTEMAFQEDPITFCFDNPDSEYCVSILDGGGFETEADTLGLLHEEGNAGDGQWFFAGSGTRANYEVIDASTEDAFGDKALKVEILTVQENHWEIQIVNTQTDVTPGKRYIMTFMIKPDEAGRQVQVAGGLDGSLEQYSYTNFDGTTDFILEEGWNEIGIHMQAPATLDEATYPDYDPLEVDHVRATISLAFPDVNPVGTTFVLDDLKVIEVDDYLSFDDDPAVYCNLFGGEQCEE